MLVALAALRQTNHFNNLSIANDPCKRNLHFGPFFIKQRIVVSLFDWLGRSGLTRYKILSGNNKEPRISCSSELMIVAILATLIRLSIGALNLGLYTELTKSNQGKKINVVIYDDLEPSRLQGVVINSRRSLVIFLVQNRSQDSNCRVCIIIDDSHICYMWQWWKGLEKSSRK